jgi:acetyl esterase
MTDEARVRNFVELLKGAFPDLGGAVCDADEARRLSEMTRRPVDNPLPVANVENRTIDAPHGPIPVRIYTPDAPARGATPALVVYFHGGGWVICDLDSHDRHCRMIAAECGAVVVSVDYRRAPDHRFPAAVDDAYAAVMWAAGHADELGADASRLAVAGDSAGGNLAAASAIVARDHGGPPIAFQLLVYPVTDHNFDTTSYRENGGGDWFLSETHMRWFWEQYLGPDGDGADPRASVLRADLRGLPPAFVMTGGRDPLRDEGEAYAAKLRAAGVAADSYRAEGLFHGFFALDDVLPDAVEPTRRAIDALAAALRPRQAAER